MADIKKVACLGAGTIGSSWAVYFLSKGLQVKIQDIDKNQIEIAKNKVTSFLNSIVGQGIISAEEMQTALKRASFTTSIAEAVEDAEFIQESALERYDIKQKVLEEVDAAAPGTAVFASSSSGLLVSRLQAFSKFPERVLVGHPFNPPHLIPLVEIVRGNAGDSSVQVAWEFYRQIGKVPIVINKEVPGHVANRIQAAVWREAIDLVVNGVCSVNDVDAAVCNGPGLRWALMGPNMIFNLGGGDNGMEGFLGQFTAPFESWWADMAAWNQFPQGSQRALIEGLKEEIGDRNTGDIVRWRDEKLIGLLKLRDLL
ncbi:3-hydroxyacyl-CoA dehydrogenase family protein [Papillibacter cinnamivorans]|uniref:3-hydroxyacyl-CoA dehydrogenase n=1 Tax=Papillibacter cinnamivorans DSM 12816 TaxID=1122930 RepID=A0A1W2BX39_9FIRM|nr:3-hydroxyacyl-CoA dehydrogenase NAD-binding domain-containing protein [Papillibacter cinnamivorans]SMC77537.1 3-hydroxyacyl-CoA dehydrogenase [Papillibacter cinnamivorans DSM 12816]